MRLTETIRLAGLLAFILDPQSSVNDQLPHEPPHKIHQSEMLVLMQFNSVLFLLSIIGVSILHSTSEAKVVRAYIRSLCFGDFSHVSCTLYMLGKEGVTDYHSWTPLVWGNVAFTCFLFVSRCLYLAGVLGKDKEPGAAKGRSVKKTQ